MTEPYLNPNLPVEERVDDLLGRVTRREKIGQCSQSFRKAFETQDAFELGADELGFYGADRCRQVEPGEFRVFVGLDSRASLETTFRVTA